MIDIEIKRCSNCLYYRTGFLHCSHPLLLKMIASKFIKDCTRRNHWQWQRQLTEEEKLTEQFTNKGW